MGDDKIKQLRDLCATILAHEDLDIEVTIGGNGTNSSEAAIVANEIIMIMGFEDAEFVAQVDAIIEELDVW